MTRTENGRTAAEAVVLLHGFGGLPLQTALLASRLRQAGYEVANIGYPSWRWPLDRIADHIHNRIDRSPLAVAPTLHFVGHSMGGLVLRALLASDRPDNLGRVVMLGTPHGGSELADLLHRLHLHPVVLNRAGPVLRTWRDSSTEALLGKVDYPLGIVAGDRPFNAHIPRFVFRAPNDGKVSVAATHCSGQSDHLVLPVAHTAMIYSRPVAQQVVHFLRHGAFHHSPKAL